MRLHTLTVRAFGPYAAEQVIDFAQLTSAGLFLLEGPTGAGKTTILDAITYALYGGLAGEESAEDRLRSHFAGPDAEPCAICEFSVRGTRYLITRVPEHTRRKRRGDGVTVQKAQVHLERMEAAGWHSLSHNKAEVADLVIEAVGLTRSQFTQVMLLPQGEFARFLRCGDDDRRKTLTKLFGTGLYDRVTAELDRRRAGAARAREGTAAAIDHAVSAAAEAAGLGGEDRAAVVALPAPGRGVRLNEIAGQLAAALAAADAELGRAEAALAVAAGRHGRAQQLAAGMNRLTGALARLHAHAATRAEHERRAATLAAARRAEPARPLLGALAEAQEVADAARDAVTGLLAGDTAHALPGPGEEAGALLAGGVPGGVAALAEGAAARAEESERAAAALEHLAAEEAGLPLREAGLADAVAAAEAASARAAALEEERAGLPDLISRLEGEWQQALAAAAGLAAAEQRLALLAAQHEAACRTAELGPLVADALAAKQQAVDAHQARTDRYQQLVDARLSGIAAELAAHLSDGKPCPVCGATHHPSVAQAEGGIVSADDVAEAAALRDAAEAERARCEQEYQQLAKDLAACDAAAGGWTQQDVAAELAEVDGAITRAQQAAGEAGQLASKLAAARARQETSGQDLRAAERHAAAAAEQAKLAAAGLAELRAKLADAAAGRGSVAERQRALQDSAVSGRVLAKALDQFAHGLAAAAAARERALREATALGFGGLADVSGAALDRAGQDELDREVTSWLTTLASLEAAAGAEDLAGLDPAQADAVAEAARAAADGFETARAAERQARHERDAAGDRAARFRQRLGDVAGAQTAHDDLVAATEAVIRLAALAKGTEGQRRVTLTTYVLRHWFSQVVAAANARLSAMSSGRYELKRTDEGESRRERAGLTLSVVDRHTGEERSPASLSGGESFYTSLALALGLADVVRAEAGGVDLDTLFIDEGFGSLDAETLDQVMAVIDDLRDRGRVVGIVSHVPDLKDRIPERLEVRRLPDGSSTTRVVA